MRTRVGLIAVVTPTVHHSGNNVIISGAKFNYKKEPTVTQGGINIEHEGAIYLNVYATIIN